MRKGAEEPDGKRPSRGRPREFDREEAVAAALRTFWTKGFERSTATVLAEAMAIQRSSFYNSFGDREALFREALEAYAAATPDAAFAELQPGQPVGPFLRRVLLRLCRTRAADPEHPGCLVVNSIGELVGVHPELGPHVAGFVSRNLAAYEAVLVQAVEQGEVAEPSDPRAAAAALAAFVTGLNTLSKVIGEERALWRICRAFLEQFGFDPGPSSGTERSPAAKRRWRRHR